MFKTLSSLVASLLMFSGLSTVVGVSAAGASDQTNTVIGTFYAPSKGGAVAVNPTNGKIYVAYRDNDSTSVVDGATNTVLATPWTGGTPQGVAVNTTTGNAYVTGSDSNNVYVIDGSTNAVRATIKVGSHPMGVAVDPTTGKVYVANQYANSVSVIDGDQNTVVSTIGVGSSPRTLAVNPTTGKVYVANYYDNSVSVIDASTNTILRTITSGSFEYPRGVAVNPTTGKVYVINYTRSTVCVINGTSDSVDSCFFVGEGPTGVAVNPTSGTVYVANLYNKLAVIDGVSNSLTQVAVNSYSSGVAVNPTTGRVYVTGLYAMDVQVIAGPVPPPAPIVNPLEATNIVVTPGNHSLGVTWTAAKSAQVDHYVVAATSGDGSTCSTRSTACSISGLSNGTAETIEVAGYDSSGTQLSSVSASPVAAAAAPDAPGQIVVTPNDHGATISWSAANAQGSPITGYTVSDGLGHTCSTTTATSCTVTGLTPGSTDSFTVTATNAMGTSVASEATPVATISATPSAPGNVGVTPGDGSLAVTWSPSTTNGGSDIAYYNVSDTQGNTCVSDASDLSCTLTGVSSRTPDTVTVTATNLDGLTSAASATVTATAGTTPDAPTNLNATGSFLWTSLSWTAPASSGVNAITSYIVTASNGATCTAIAPATTCVISNLVGGTPLSFTVVAVNAFGSSMASNTAIASAYDVPGIPTQVSASVQANGTIVVSWTAPSANGSAISGYSVSDGHGHTCTAAGSASSCIVGGLTKGNDYSFAVFATNQAGNSGTSTPSAPVVDAQAPDAPGNVAVWGGDTAALLSWSAPAANGSPIVSYVVTASTGQTCETDQTSCLLGGLTNGTPVTFSVVAINGAGSSLASSLTSPIVPAGVPSAPTSLNVVSALDGSVSLSWTASIANGTPVTNYVVTDGLGDTCSSTTTSCSISGLTNGTTYSFTVTASSAAGSSTSSNLVTARPISTPGAPTKVKAVAGSGSITVSFSAPAKDGGGIVTAYKVSDGSGNACTTSTPGSCRFTGLSNGTADTFQVTAWNAAGSSPAASVTATPVAAPTAPTGVSAVPSNAAATVSWTASFANGAAVTSYKVTASSGQTCATQGALSCVVSGLTNGAGVSFSVRATNSIGISAASGPSPIVTPATVPNAPGGLSATAGNGSASFTWSAPARSGGSPVTGYTVSDAAGDHCSTTTQTTCVVSGLSNGTSYAFSVVATNAMGPSNASSAISVVPMTVASAPTISSVSSVSGGVKVTLIAPTSTGGSPLTSYQVSIDGGSTWSTAALSSVTASSFLVNQLTGGTSYRVAIRAINSVGASAASNVVSVTFVAPPSAPTIVSAIVSGTSVTVTYTAPASNGGANVTMYQYSLDGGVTWQIRPTGTASSFILSNLTRGTSAKLVIRGFNTAGAGASSKTMVLRIN